MSKANFFIFLLHLGNMFQDLFGQKQLPKTSCDRTTRVLNDCNWCTCVKMRFVCETRACNVVDMFGHFNDAIREIDVGMEGHGVWRTQQPSCQPNVHYSRNNLLCVCTEEGNWPNPVCSEIFRVLHPVLVTAIAEPSSSQTCTPNILYLVGCNVCFCPATGSINPDLCTKRACSLDDPVLIPRSVVESEHREAEGDVYAECDEETHYRLGCRSCRCFRNNRLECSQCAKGTQADCTGRKPGEAFAVQCNFCICDEQGQSVCTMINCKSSEDRLTLQGFTPGNASQIEVKNTIIEKECEPGKWYIRDCNHCFCFQTEKGKLFICTSKICQRPLRRNDPKIVLELERICSNDAALCFNNQELEIKLDSLHGNCEPSHVYEEDCNTCKCLADGKTVRCTTKVCKDLQNKKGEANKPVVVDLLPVRLSAEGQCPKGHSFKIDCNYCYCLNNGNAICTTVHCKKRKWALD